MDKYVSLEARLGRFVSLCHLSSISLSFCVFPFEIFIFISHLHSCSLISFRCNKTALLMEELSTVFVGCVGTCGNKCAKSIWTHVATLCLSLHVACGKVPECVVVRGGFPCCFMAKPRGGRSRRGEGVQDGCVCEMWDCLWWCNPGCLCSSSASEMYP